MSTIQAVNLTRLEGMPYPHQGQVTQTNAGKNQLANEMILINDEQEHAQKGGLHNQGYYGNLASFTNDGNSKGLKIKKPKSNMQMSNQSLQVNSQNPLNPN